jgi:negative regulator of sigma E activity
MEIKMKQRVDEQLSAFLDDELPTDELEFLLRRLEKAEDARSTLNRYAMIGSILRDEYSGSAADVIRAGVSERIAEEDAHHDRRAAAKSKNGSAWKGMGIAAALALVAYLSVDIRTGPEIPPQVRQAIVEPTLQAVQPAAPVVGQPKMRQATITPVRLATYMVSHGEYARSFPWTVMDSRAMVQQATFEE